jgi:class 3 adenylate cyclase
MPLPRRVTFATVAVTGLSTFVALAVGVTLYFASANAVRSTQELIAEQAESQLDALEARIAARLAPVETQAAAIARALHERRIDLARGAELDAYMLGALSATPQVSGMAIVEAGGKTRRWSTDAGAQRADWSPRPDVREWLSQGASENKPAWRAPIWTPVRRVPALLHDAPLERDGRFVGMLGQVVPIAKVSEELAQFRAEHGVTPFILYGAERVLAHPALAGAAGAQRGEPLATIAEIGDPVLAALREPQRFEPLGLRRLKRARGGQVRVSGDPYLYFYREVRTYGQPWTLGVYVDPVAGGQRAQIVSLVASVAGGLAVLVLAALAAAFAGKYLARSVQALADAARAVREERMEEMPKFRLSGIVEFDEARQSFQQMMSALRERAIMRNTLGQLVPEQVARRLLAAGGRLEPVEDKVTILMCDIEGFTALTDSLGRQRVFEFLNEYFDAVVAIIERHGGVITQFQGDAILAVFNLPLPDRDHAAQALRAALEIVRACDENTFAGVRARNRIGITTGRVVAGAVGSSGRLSYTVHGNAVNLAARIEAANKDYGTRILLSEKTAERCPDFRLRKVAEAPIRGYAEPVPLFTPVGD